jgi:hypothetical protein
MEDLSSNAEDANSDPSHHRVPEPGQGILDPCFENVTEEEGKELTRNEVDLINGEGCEVTEEAQEG